MKRVIRSISDGLHTCPICETHQEYLGKLAQHIRQHHAKDTFTAAQLQQLKQLGLKCCPSCSLVYSATNNTFARHVNQCQGHCTPTLSRKRRANSHMITNTSANKRSKALTINTNSSSSSSLSLHQSISQSPISPIYSPVTPIMQNYEPESPINEAVYEPSNLVNSVSAIANDENSASIDAIEEKSASVVAAIDENFNAPIVIDANLNSFVAIDENPASAVIVNEIVSSSVLCSVSPLDIANHAKLLRKVPHTNRSIFIATMRRLLANYTKASMDQDSATLHNCLVEILMLPGQTMISRRGGKKGRQRDSAIMHHRLMERNLPSSASSSPLSSASILHRPATRSTTQAPILSSIARSIALTREGHYRRAVTALSSSTPLVDTSQMDKLSMLQQLHPFPLPHDSALPMIPSDTPMVTVNADEGLVKIIHQMINGSAPGPSGWTTEMVGVLTDDEDCLAGLAMLIQDITNGTLPDSTKDFVLPSNLIGLDKHNGASVRPIAIGEVFYRIAAYRGQLYVQHVIKDLLQPIQLGVATSGGCEAVVHNLQHALEQETQPVAALAIDFRNAFNSVSRKVMLETLYSHPRLQYIWRLVDFAYSAPTNLYVRGADRALSIGMYSTQGVRQGDRRNIMYLTVELHKNQYPTTNKTTTQKLPQEFRPK